MAVAEYYPSALQRLVALLTRLPGVGRRSADRAALELVVHPEKLVELLQAMEQVQSEVALCPLCRGLAPSQSPCGICADPRRDKSVLCVVESVADLVAMERGGVYPGRYFVLHRLLSPLKGVGPQDIRLDLIEQRVESGEVKEVILATPLTADGETTATYLRRTLAPYPVRVTRLATGVPVGGALEYLDGVTLSRAMADRKEFEPV